MLALETNLHRKRLCKRNKKIVFEIDE